MVEDVQRKGNGVTRDLALNVPANFGLSELTVFSSTRPDTPPLAGPDYTTVTVKEFVGKTPLERNMELDDEQKEAEEALRTAQLQDTRAWLRQVEEENEVKLRERLNEQRKVQQEHFCKLDIRGEYLPPALAFQGLPTGKSLVQRKRQGGVDSESEDEENSASTASDENKWAENVHNNQIAGSPASMHPAHQHEVAMSPKMLSEMRGGRRSNRMSCPTISSWIFALILHDLGLILLCLWIFNRADSNEIPWKWLGFTDED